MRATYLNAPGEITVETAPDPSITAPTDAVVRVVAACICGSDLWPYRGVAEVPQPRRMGHEAVGVVVEVGAEVSTVRPGAFVVLPFVISDGTCPSCRNGIQTSCHAGSMWGATDRSGAVSDALQAEHVRVPFADGTLVATPEMPDDAMVPALLALSDVMGTGHHAALSAGVGPGRTVIVVGDGAVGLCGVLASARLGAERIVMMSRHADRQALARRFGATDVVEQRGKEGAALVRDMFDGIGADCVLECVGTKESMEQAIASTRPGGTVGYVGAPYGSELPVRTLFNRNINVAGGVAPVRAALPELMADVLAGRLDPGPVFDRTLPLDDVAAGYAAMDDRTAIKVLLRP